MAGKTKTKKVHAWYALRRTLPVWSFEENLKELIEFLPRYRVDEVVVKVDTEEFTHGQPPFKWIKRYQKNLFRIKEELGKLGIVYSLNPWITVGHNDRGRDSRKSLPGLQTMVGEDGNKCINCACPLCKVWRENTAKVWKLYAETEPHVMWVEDDIRTVGHGPAALTCFCPLHMKKFGERVGRKVSREELVRAIVKPGKPHGWRKEFLDMQGEGVVETVSFLAKTVHAVSPETNLGLMTSAVRTHCLEGRRWGELCEGLADGKGFYVRPPMGNYSEESLRGFYYSHDSIKLTRHCTPAGAIEQTEVESVPFTRYSKSAAATFIEIAISFAYGCDGVTLNIFDHCGTPMESEAVFGKLLGEKKKFLESLARRAQQSGRYRGVGICFDQRSSYFKKLAKNDGFRKLAEDGREAMWMLEAAGIPTTYDDSEVMAVSGQSLRAFSDERIDQLLSKGLLLDAAAAQVLCERGFAGQIGIKTIAKPRCIDELGAFSAEEFFNTEFGGGEKKFLTLTIPTLGSRPGFSVTEPVKNAKIISRIVDPDARRSHVCMFAYENELGGRAVVHAFELAKAYGVSFNHPFRQEQLQSVVDWLGRGKSAIMVRGGGVYPLAFRKDCEKFTLLGFFNLSLDAWGFVEFEIADRRAIDKMEVLSDSGRWCKNKNLSAKKKGGKIFVRYEGEIGYDDPLFVCIGWE